MHEFPYRDINDSKEQELFLKLVFRTSQETTLEIRTSSMITLRVKQNLGLPWWFSGK